MQGNEISFFAWNLKSWLKGLQNTLLLGSESKHLITWLNEAREHFWLNGGN